MFGTQGIHWVHLGTSVSNDNSEKAIEENMDWLENSKKGIRPLRVEGLSFIKAKQPRLAAMLAKDEWNIKWLLRRQGDEQQPYLGDQLQQRLQFVPLGSHCQYFTLFYFT